MATNINAQQNANKVKSNWMEILFKKRVYIPMIAILGTISVASVVLLMIVSSNKTQYLEDPTSLNSTPTTTRNERTSPTSIEYRIH